MLGVALLLGHALGYRMPPGWQPMLAILCGLTPAMLILLRCLGRGEPEQNYPPALALGLGLAILSTAALARLTLHWWGRLGGTRAQLIRLYSLELLGSACGLMLAVAAGPLGLLRIFPWLVVPAFAFLRPLALVCALAAMLQSLWLPAWMLAAARLVHRSGGATDVLEAAFSPYQLVEAVDYGGQRHLFLNGLCHHNPGILKALNYYLSALPARLLNEPARSQGALILGGGALLSAAETRREGLDTTVVELDPVVLRISQTYFARDFGLDPADPGLHLVCDDARRYTRGARHYGLIVFSLPYPYSINVASLFTREYFAQLRERLAPGGILTVFLGSPAERGGRLDPVATSIFHSLRLEFPYTLPISSREMSNTVVLCTREHGLSRTAVGRQCARDGYRRFHFLSNGPLDTPPTSLWDLRICARLNLSLW